MKIFMAAASALCALSLLLFVAGIEIASVGLNLFASVLFALLYAHTPQAFEVRVRGTMFGIASALGRMYI